MKRFALAQRHGDRSLALGCHQLAELSRAGASLVEALEAVAASEPLASRRPLWRELGRAVGGGAPLSRALALSHPPFPVDLCARVRAAEADGQLAPAFDDLEASLLQSARHSARLRNALAYPLLASVVLTLTLGFLLVRIVPPLSNSAGSEAFAWHALPLVWLSNRLVGPFAGSLLVLVPMLGFGAALALYVRLRDAAGSATRALDLARVAGTVARLHVGGVPLDEAIAVASGGCRGAALAQDLQRARTRVVAGGSLSASLADAASVPPLFLRFVAAGESTGALDAALVRAAAHLESEALRVLARREALAGPAVLCVAGLALCWVVVSILLPVYERAFATGLS